MKKSKEKLIKSLRLFFNVSVAAFEFQNSVVSALGKTPHISNMHSLHLLARAEIMKDKPDMNLIDTYLKLMEEEAKKYNK